LIEAGEAGVLHLFKRPADFTAALRGLCEEIWRGENPEAYIAAERKAWEEE